jgi:hypothetical protein
MVRALLISSAGRQVAVIYVQDRLCNAPRYVWFVYLHSRIALEINRSYFSSVSVVTRLLAGRH